LSHGHGAPRHFLRWLHQRGAGNIRITAVRDGLTLTAPLSRAVCRQQLDYSGPDIDLARALVGSQQLEAVTWVLELDAGVRRRVVSGGPEAWQLQDSCGSTEAALRLSGCSSLLPRWRQEIATAFGSSTTAIHWNDTLLSGPYVCPGPV